jgi:hypothetical protein
MRRSLGPVVLLVIGLLLLGGAVIMATSTMHVDGNVSCGSLVSKVEPSSDFIDPTSRYTQEAMWSLNCGRQRSSRTTETVVFAVAGIAALLFAGWWYKVDGDAMERDPVVAEA